MALGVDRNGARGIGVACDIGRRRRVQDRHIDRCADRRPFGEGPGGRQGLRIERGVRRDVDAAARLEMRSAARRGLGVELVDDVDRDRPGDAGGALAARRRRAPGDEIVGLAGGGDRLDRDAVTTDHGPAVDERLVSGVDHVHRNARANIGAVIHRQGRADALRAGVVLGLRRDQHRVVRSDVRPMSDLGGVVRRQHVDRHCSGHAHAALVATAFGRARAVAAVGLVLRRRQRCLASLAGVAVVVDLMVGLAVGAALAAAAILFRVVLVLAFHRRDRFGVARHRGRRRHRHASEGRRDVARQLGADALDHDRDGNGRADADAAAGGFGAGRGFELALVRGGDRHVAARRKRAAGSRVGAHRVLRDQDRHTDADRVAARGAILAVRQGEIAGVRGHRERACRAAPRRAVGDLGVDGIDRNVDRDRGANADVRPLAAAVGGQRARLVRFIACRGDGHVAAAGDGYGSRAQPCDARRAPDHRFRIVDHHVDRDRAGDAGLAAAAARGRLGDERIGLVDELLVVVTGARQQDRLAGVRVLDRGRELELPVAQLDKVIAVAASQAADLAAAVRVVLHHVAGPQPRVAPEVQQPHRTGRVELDFVERVGNFAAGDCDVLIEIVLGSGCPGRQIHQPGAAAVLRMVLGVVELDRAVLLHVDVIAVGAEAGQPAYRGIQVIEILDVVARFQA